MANTEHGLPAVSNDPRFPQSGAAVDLLFASMGRDELEELQSLENLLQGIPLFQQIIDAMPIRVSVLNEKGQVVLMNRQYCRAQETNMECAVGKRHGELLCCIHSEKGPEGCGTSRECERCGAAVSIAASLQSKGQAIREYRLTRQTPDGPETVDWIVASTPFWVDDRGFVIFAVQDMNPQRVRDSLLLESKD